MFVRLSDANVVFFRYTANNLQVFFIVSCIFFVFPSLGVLCRGVFLFFFLRFLPSSVRATSYYICTRTHAGGGAPWVEGCGCKGGDIHHGGRISDGGRVSSVGGGGCWFLMQGRRCWWSLQWSRGCQGRGPGIYAAQTGRGAGTAPVAWRRVSRAKWAFFVAG